MDGSAFKGLWIVPAVILPLGIAIVFALGFLVGRCGQ